ncbi:MAG TPA: C2H2-type zinc finger protein [Candidatus Binatus sp.]|nr:C2H2-type zinc finger protein [Candidatus Binatus sp.]
MNRNLLILGIIFIVLGGAAAGYFYSIGEGTRTRTYGSEGIAVLGVVLLIASVTMKPGATKANVTGQFQCSKCAASFGSEMALNSHMRDKHGA